MTVIHQFIDYIRSVRRYSQRTAEIYEKLKLDKIIDESILPENINFKIESILIGNVEEDSWDRAFYRVDLKLRQIRNRIRAKLNEMRNR